MTTDRFDSPLDLTITSDEYGMPLDIFGPHNPDFFPLLGRIIALASVVERDVRSLGKRLVPDAPELGKPSFSRVVDAIRQGLIKIVDDASRERLKRYLSNAEKVVDRRNKYAHSLWPSLSLDHGTTVVGWQTWPWEQEFPVGDQLEVMRDDVRMFSEVVMQWNQEILDIYNKIPLSEDGAT